MKPTFTFIEPNFRCQVTEPGSLNNTKEWMLVYAQNESDAEGKFTEKGYDVHKIEKYDFKNKWLIKAKAEKALALKAKGKNYKFKPIWKELKVHLQDIFHGNCAYCRASYLATAFGDVEHYRPKGRVEDDPKHPGYYWKAYDFDNYLPSCSKCNRKEKRSKFPIHGTRATSPTDPLDLEKPLLINPFLKEFSESIKILPSTHVPDSKEDSPGWAVPLDEFGKESIKVYGLNRPYLRIERLKEQQNMRRDYKQAYANWLGNDIRDRWDEIVAECKVGKRKFSLAAINEINAYCKGKNVPSPFPKK